MWWQSFWDEKFSDEKKRNCWLRKWCDEEKKAIQKVCDEGDKSCDEEETNYDKKLVIN